jgi:hypothetical protein
MGAFLGCRVSTAILAPSGGASHLREEHSIVTASCLPCDPLQSWACLFLSGSASLVTCLPFPKKAEACSELQQYLVHFSLSHWFTKLRLPSMSGDHTLASRNVSSHTHLDARLDITPTTCGLKGFSKQVQHAQIKHHFILQLWALNCVVTASND